MKTNPFEPEATASDEPERLPEDPRRERPGDRGEAALATSLQRLGESGAKTQHHPADESLRLLNSAVQAAANGVVITDTNGTIQWVNAAFTTLTGYSAEEAIGKNPRVLKSGQQSEAAYRELWNTVAEGRVWRGELINRRKDGTFYHEEMHITPVCDASGKITHYIAIKQDVSERVRNEAQLQETNEQLRREIAHREQVEAQLLRAQRLESIGTLASGVAHNLNNMLTPILMGVPALLGNLPQDARVMLVRTIQASAQRATDIVRQLVTFARGADGECQALHVGELIGEVAKTAEETFPKSIVVCPTVADDLAQAEADPTQIRQLLMNLCINARDAMPEGGVLVLEAENFDVDENYASLTPEARVGRYVAIRVTDSGTGIPQELLDRIFDPFFSTKPAEKGSGLGLSTVAGIVRGHGGFIAVRTAVGKGTTFEICLPALAHPVAPVVATPRVEVAPAAGHGESVLVVDDEAGLREVTSAILDDSGYHTLTAVNGADALRIYAEHRDEIDVVLTDLLMPVLDGVALCRKLLAINPNVKIIASTGEAEAGKFDELHEMGVTHFLPKPYTIDRMLSAMQAAQHDAGPAPEADRVVPETPAP